MSPTQNNNSDEIDLKDLFGHISKGIRDFIGKIIDLIALVRRVTIDNFKLFILIIAIFLLGSIGYDQGIKKDVFGSYMLVNSIYLNKQLVDNSVSKLNALAGELDKQTLAKVLNIDTGTAMLINGFEVEPFVTESEKLEIEILKEKLLNLKLDDEIIENIIAQIEIRNPNTFKITVFTETNEVVETLDSAINQYFLQNNYLKKRIEINRTTLLKRKDKLLKEQFKIDSLKQTIFEVYQSMSKDQNSSKGSDNIILAGQEIANPLDVFKEDISINDLILSIERRLFLKNEFEVIEGLTPFNKPVSMSFMKFIAFTVLSGIVFTYILIILRGMNNFFVEREKQLTSE
jgi:hypothetical protein